VPIVTGSWGDGQSEACPSYAGILFLGNRLTTQAALTARLSARAEALDPSPRKGYYVHTILER